MPFGLLVLIVYIVLKAWVSSNGRGSTNLDATPAILTGNKLFKNIHISGAMGFKSSMNCYLAHKEACKEYWVWLNFLGATPTVHSFGFNTCHPKGTY